MNCSRHPPEVVQDCGGQAGGEQQQGEDVGGQQQGPGQPLQSVQGQRAKGLLTQVQTGIKVPAGGAAGAANQWEREENEQRVRTRKKK